jgi:hypothetical protein
VTTLTLGIPRPLVQEALFLLCRVGLDRSDDLFRRAPSGQQGIQNGRRKAHAAFSRCLRFHARL